MASCAIFPARASARPSQTKADVEKFQATETFDEIYHLASPTSPLWYMAKSERMISTNLMSTFRLLDLLSPGGRFCYTSTSEAYVDPLVRHQPESYHGSVDCTGPRYSCDASERCTDPFLFESQQLHGLNIRVVRLFNVYSPRTRPDDGRAVSNFITQAFAGQPLTVYGTPAAQARRQRVATPNGSMTAFVEFRVLRVASGTTRSGSDLSKVNLRFVTEFDAVGFASLSDLTT